MADDDKSNPGSLSSPRDKENESNANIKNNTDKSERKRMKSDKKPFY